MTGVLGERFSEKTVISERTGVRRMHDFGESLADALIEIDGRLPPGDESQNVEITGPAWARLLELAQDQAHADAGWKQAIDLALSEKSDKELEGPWTVNERARDLRRRVVVLAGSVFQSAKAVGSASVDVAQVVQDPPGSFEAVPPPKKKRERKKAPHCSFCGVTGHSSDACDRSPLDIKLVGEGSFLVRNLSVSERRYVAGFGFVRDRAQAFKYATRDDAAAVGRSWWENEFEVVEVDEDDAFEDPGDDGAQLEIPQGPQVRGGAA